MAATLPDAVSEAIIAVVLPASSTRYISLHSADPGKTGASEIAGTGYARVAMTEASDFAAAAADGTSGGRKRVTANDANFGTAGSAWGTITHVGIWDDPTSTSAAHFKGGTPLTAPQTIASGNPVKFLAGDFVLVGAGF